MSERALHLKIDEYCGCSEGGKGCMCAAPRACHEQGLKPAVFLISCLMWFLKQKPAHGYELMKQLTSMPFLKLLSDPGAIYRQL